MKDLRETEAKRSRLYSVLELMGTDAPNLADIGPRLRELNNHLKTLEQGVIKLEEEPAGPAELRDCDVDEVAGMLRGLVQDCGNSKKQRTFMGSFIEKATVSGDSVAVYYNEGRFMSLGSTVRSDGKWRPMPDSNHDSSGGFNNTKAEGFDWNEDCLCKLSCETVTLLLITIHKTSTWMVLRWPNAKTQQNRPDCNAQAGRRKDHDQPWLC